MSEKAFQDYYPDDLSHCFGCGRLNEYGHQIKSYGDGEERGSATSRPRQWLRGREEPSNILEDWADSVAAYVYPHYAVTVKPPRGPWVISESRWNYVGQHLNPQHIATYPWGGFRFST